MLSTVGQVHAAMDQLASLKLGNQNDTQIKFKDDHSSNQIETIWLNVFRELTIDERIKFRQVCSMFRRLATVECHHLSLSIRSPLPVAQNLNQVIPYHQLYGSKTSDGSSSSVKYPAHVDCLLLWKNEIKLIHALPLLFPQIRSLQFVSESESYPNSRFLIPVEYLVRLPFLEHLQLYGDAFFLENYKGYQIVQLKRLEVGPSAVWMCNGSHWINDLSYLCPSLVTLKCCSSCLQFLAKPLTYLKKWHSTNRHFDQKYISSILKYLPGIEKVYIPIPFKLDTLHPLFDLVNLKRLHLHYNFKKMDDYLDQYAYDKPQTYRPKLVQALKDVNLDKINVQVNGFRLCQPLEQSLDKLMLFLSSQAWNAKAVIDLDFDRYRADKIRTRELRKISFQEKVSETDLFSSHRRMLECFVYGKSSSPITLDFFKSLPLLFPNITFLSIDAPSLAQNVRFDLRVLLQMKNLRRCNLFRVLCSYPEILLKIWRNLPFLEIFSVHEMKLENRRVKKLLLAAREKSLLHPQILYQVAGNGRVYYQFRENEDVFIHMPSLRQTLQTQRLKQLK